MAAFDRHPELYKRLQFVVSGKSALDENFRKPARDSTYEPTAGIRTLSLLSACLECCGKRIVGCSNADVLGKCPKDAYQNGEGEGA